MTELPVIQRETESSKALMAQIKSTIRISEQGIANIIKALVVARPKFGSVKKSSNNPYYKSKYADLEELINAVAIPLAEQGLIVMQFPDTSISDRETVVTTLLAHTSGEWIESSIKGPAEQKSDKGTRFDIQTEGASISYLRRYALKSLLLLPEEDDDGNSLASHPEPKKAFVPPVSKDSVRQPIVSPESELGITEKDIRADSDGCPISDEDLPENLRAKPKPTATQLKGYSDRLKNLKFEDNRGLKQWFEGIAGTEWKNTDISAFEKVVSLAEKLHQEGKLKETVQEFIAKLQK